MNIEVIIIVNPFAPKPACIYRQVKSPNIRQKERVKIPYYQGSVFCCPRRDFPVTEVQNLLSNCIICSTENARNADVCPLLVTYKSAACPRLFTMHLLKIIYHVQKSGIINTCSLLDYLLVSSILGYFYSFLLF